jgi:predicted Ser/Thr protein kinase
MAEFRERGCDVLGISTDSIATHERWLKTPLAQGGLGELSFPLASDEDGAASRAYGVYLERQHAALRGTFLIDPNGVLQYQLVHSLTLGRNTDEILGVLEGLQLGGLCPGERRPGEAVMDVGLELGPNRVIGPYRVEEKLGGGSFGTVFRARDLNLDREVALKVLRPGSPVPPMSLLVEARAAAALSHPNVCAIHAVDSSLGAPIIVMEYIAGRPLTELLGEGAMATARVSNICRQIALGMEAAHAKGVVHGDLKPANILITDAGTVKIVDFGMARRAASPVRGEETGLWEVHSPGGISGTPAYMAPEQARGEAPTPASDIFSLGVMLYELVTGQRARAEGNLLELIHRIDHEDLTKHLAEPPGPFGEVLRLALAAIPAARRITMTQIAAMLA